MRLKIVDLSDAECMLALIQEEFKGKLNGRTLIRSNEFTITILPNTDHVSNMRRCDYVLSIHNNSRETEVYDEIIKFVKENRQSIS